jgi:ATP-dependent DNA helicase RecG
MTLSEKEVAMEKFRRGETHILVATAVVEVGVDVPNASVMLIDGADRFGLSQLHQFRGRIGRGKHQSHCILMSDKAGEDAKKRMDILRMTTDGFKLAEEDLKMRGYGDFLGTRQSGQPIFKVAQISDTDLVSLVSLEAKKLLETDANFDLGLNFPLKERYEQMRSDLRVN